MENDRVVLLVGIIGVFVVLIVALAFRNRVRSKTKVGPVNFDFEADPSARGASLRAGNVSQGSEVVNEGAGGPAEMEVKDISGSKVINTAGQTSKD
jgi:hypothetical protein